MAGNAQVSTLVLNADGMPVSVMPLNTLNWQEAVKAIWLNSVSVVEYYDDWAVHSPNMTIRIPSVVMTKRYVNPARTMIYSPENLFLRDNYRCAYCLHHFSSGHLTVDHVLPRSLGGKTNFENLVAACSPCNNKRGSNYNIRPNWAPYKPNYYEMVEKARQRTIHVPHASWVPYLCWPDPAKVIVNGHGQSPITSDQVKHLAA